MAPTRTPPVDALDLAASLERLVALVRSLIPSPGLSLTAASTLRMLAASGPHRLSDLAARQSVTQPAMTQLVTRLERDGLVQRGGSAQDARVVLVSVTPAGRDMLDARRLARARRLGELLDALPHNERGAIVAAIPALNHLADLGLDVELPDRGQE